MYDGMTDVCIIQSRRHAVRVPRRNGRKSSVGLLMPALFSPNQGIDILQSAIIQDAGVVAKRAHLAVRPRCLLHDLLPVLRRRRCLMISAEMDEKLLNEDLLRNESESTLLRERVSSRCVPLLPYDCPGRMCAPMAPAGVFCSCISDNDRSNALASNSKPDVTDVVVIDVSVM